MLNLTTCRRTFIAACGIILLTALGAYRGLDVGMPIATICLGIAGANAYERSSVAKTATQYKS